ncbi:AAA family ATPase [Azospirillum sp. HJ39]|uniref:AAA family ATPase n=1 Tax=Azospirillum sp. HJ39 TaxID=3159496 RepID=UPI003555E86E
MSDLTLKSLDITNFRSIRGHVHAPLDAQVVLLHGENGAGKTSFLSAAELALTGRVQSLLRADPDYESQLLHRSAAEGSILLRTSTGTSERKFESILSATGAQSNDTLAEPLASFFRERAFLPQSLLGQLLQIYQDARNDAGSPLAQFVSKLLGLDRLDTLEAGLKPFVDVRNVRKNVEGWLEAEGEKDRFKDLLVDQRKSREKFHGQVEASICELATLCAELELSVEVREETLDDVATALAEPVDAEVLARLADQQRKLASIRREIIHAQSVISPGTQVVGISADDAGRKFTQWETTHGAQVSRLRSRIEGLLPDLSASNDPAQFSEEALTRLRAEHKQLTDYVSRARSDIVRHAAALDERDVARRQRDTIEEEIAQLPSGAGSFGSALAELTSFIADDICPVCDRDFGEVSKRPLGEHIHRKVRTLSASAERLLVLGRTRSEVQVIIERLDWEIEAIDARRLEPEALAEVDRRQASIETAITELEGLIDTVREGGRLRTAAIAAQRMVNAVQSSHLSLAAVRETLNSFAFSIGTAALVEDESFEAAASRLDAFMAARAAHLEQRLLLRRKGVDYITTIRTAITRRQEVDAQIKVDLASHKRAEQALARAQVLRSQGVMIRTAVDKVRSAIIRREFNDRLNRVWRDLFVRLAPGEPFVPAFRIPESSTQRLQPKLVTEHRDGGENGGTPGAMLSSGNLNTAALTLFIALHLSVPGELPWLILDDPVQSMDDVHIAHFAALLRTLSKEHGRQVMIAVHDRQLFEYLKLELSPAFPTDSLLTLELSRGSRRDSTCLATRFSFKEETAFLTAA